MFFCALAARFELYKKGTSTADSGYLARKLNQGSGNTFVGHNGILFADG